MTALSPPPGFGVPFVRQSSQHQAGHPPRSGGRKVSWATDDKLCQIRLFVAEDAPTMLGSAQEQLQAKQARNVHIFSDAGDDTPPGFGGVAAARPKSSLMALAAVVPQISWRPPSFVQLDPNWHVVAGTASLESGLQKQREVRMLEAVYPRPSAIPESPAEPGEQQEPYDDSKTPQIPLVPLEEEDLLPEGNDIPGIPSSARFGGPTSAQVAGVQASSSSDPSFGVPNGRSFDAHGNPSSSSSRPMGGGHTPSESISGGTRPALPDVLATHLQGSGQANSQPNAAAEAVAALSRSQEAGGSADTHLLARLLQQDPAALMRSLGVQRPLQSPGPPSSAATRDSDLQVGIQRGGSFWPGSPGPPSTSYAPSSTGQERTVLSRTSFGRGGTVDDRHLAPLVGSVRMGHHVTTPGAGGGQEGTISWHASNSVGLDDRHLGSMVGPGRAAHVYADLVSGRVGPGPISAPADAAGSSGFGVGKAGPPGFGSKPTPPAQHMGGPMGVGPTTQGTARFKPGQMAMNPQAVGPGAQPRSFSQLEEQYFKTLILKHGVDGDDNGSAGAAMGDPAKGFVGSLPRVTGAPPAKRWFAGEEAPGLAKPDRNGRERRDGERNISAGSVDANAQRPKSRKVCMYFGTPRGCRNGDHCAFLHESGGGESQKADNLDRVRSAAASSAQVYYSKRLKVDG